MNKTEKKIQKAHIQSLSQQFLFLWVIYIITTSFKHLNYNCHLIQQHSLLRFCYKLETYLLCSSPCSPEGTVKHSSMWPCNNLRTSPPIRYPWTKGENRVHFSKHSHMYNCSSICNKFYQVDFSFFCLKFYITLKNRVRRGRYLILCGASWTLPSEKSSKSATWDGWIRIKKSHKQGIILSYHNSEKDWANQNKESSTPLPDYNRKIGKLFHFTYSLFVLFKVRILVKIQKPRLI